MLDSLEVLLSILHLNRAGRNVTSTAIRVLGGGSHKRAKAILEGLEDKGLLVSHVREYRANCKSLCYDLTAHGVRLVDILEMSMAGKRMDDESIKAIF